MRRATAWIRGIGLSLAASLAALPACDSAVSIKNALPRVTWVAAEPVDADGVVALTVWISDTEGDSVDLALEWREPGGAATAVELAAGGYGLVGLPTRDALFDAEGQPSLILWKTTESARAAATVQLRMTPDDLPFNAKHGVGETVVSPPFALSAGLPDAEPAVSE